MNAERAKKFLPLIVAVAEGKTLQVKGKDGNWYGTHLNDFDPDRYRIKPEPRTFKMWLASSGVMYPEKMFDNGKPYELITVQEVLQ